MVLSIPTDAPFLPADLTDYGQTLEALSGAETMSGVEAVVHLAAIPSPVHATPDGVFATNIRSTHTVFAAASSSREAPKPAAPHRTTLRLARASAAELRAPTSAPAPKLALSRPNTSGPDRSVCAVRTGSSVSCVFPPW